MEPPRTRWITPWLAPRLTIAGFSSTVTITCTACLSCLHYGMSAVCHLELVEDVRDVIAHRFFAQREAVGDLHIATPLRNQGKYFALSLGKFRESLRRHRWAGVCEEADEALGYSRREYGLSVSNRTDRPQYLLLVGAFEQIPPSPCSHGGENRV